MFVNLVKLTADTGAFNVHKPALLVETHHLEPHGDVELCIERAQFYRVHSNMMSTLPGGREGGRGIRRKKFCRRSETVASFLW